MSDGLDQSNSSNSKNDFEKDDNPVFCLVLELLFCLCSSSMAAGE